MAWIKLNPLRSQHKVNMVVVLVSPELEHFPQIKLADYLVSSNESIHVGLQPKLRVH
jgi:hypothetical protein